MLFEFKRDCRTCKHMRKQRNDFDGWDYSCDEDESPFAEFRYFSVFDVMEKRVKCNFYTAKQRKEAKNDGRTNA